MSDATKLSILEQASCIQLKLLHAIDAKDLNSHFQLYFVERSVFGVCAGYYTPDEWTRLKKTPGRTTDLHFRFVHPTPPAEQIIEGDPLIVTPAVAQAAKSFCDAWRNDPQFPIFDEDQPVLILPGAFIAGLLRRNDEGKRVKVAQICFPLSPHLLSRDEQKAQAAFAAELINLNGKCDVVIGGCPVRDVIAEARPMAVLRECRTWRERVGWDDSPVMPQLVLDMIAEFEARLAVLKDWQKQGRDAPFLPPGVSVLHPAEGILGLNSGTGLAAISAYPTDLPDDVLERLRDAILR